MNKCLTNSYSIHTVYQDENGDETKMKKTKTSNNFDWQFWAYSYRGISALPKYIQNVHGLIPTGTKN